MPPELETFVEELSEVERRDKHILWKIKGIAAKATYKLFSRYGNPKTVEPEMTQFAHRFGEQFSLPLLESHLQVVFRRKTNFVGSVCLNYAIRYLCAAIKVPITMGVLINYAENLLYETVVPIMLITHKDVLLYKDNPIDYIRS